MSILSGSATAFPRSDNRAVNPRSPAALDFPPRHGHSISLNIATPATAAATVRTLHDGFKRDIIAAFDSLFSGSGNIFVLF